MNWWVKKAHVWAGCGAGFGARGVGFCMIDNDFMFGSSMS